MARRMVMSWGMSERLGPVSYKLSDEDPFLGREMHQQRQFSEHTMELIDDEVGRILREQSDRAFQTCSEPARTSSTSWPSALLAKEELDDQRNRSHPRQIGPRQAQRPADRNLALGRGPGDGVNCESRRTIVEWQVEWPVWRVFAAKRLRNTAWDLGPR